MDPIDFNPPRLANSPNLPHLRSALVQIGEEIDRGERKSEAKVFVPFGRIAGFVATDPRSEMNKSLGLAPNKAGLLRFGQDRAPGLSDLPKLSISAAKPGSRPPKSSPVVVEVTPMEISVVDTDGSVLNHIGFDELQNVRIDNAGRFFFVVAGAGNDPLCLTARPWIVLALALLMVGATRKDGLRELQADIDEKVRSL